MADDDEFPFARPEGSDAPDMFIQWKGTDVCLDFECQCGANGHFDGMFAYYLRCPECGAIYRMGTQVIAKRMDDSFNPDGESVQDLADVEPL